MSEQKNSGLCCYICVFILILFAFFNCMPYMYLSFVSPFSNMLIVIGMVVLVIGIVSFVSVTINESKRRRIRPTSYNNQKNYAYASPYVARNPVNHITLPRLSRTNELRSNTVLETQYCRECGASIIIRPSFCQNCGTQLNTQEINYSRQIENFDKKYTEKRALEIDFCTCCGTRPENDSIYCSQCGMKLT